MLVSLGMGFQVNPMTPVCPAFPPDPATGEAATSVPPPPSTVVDETISDPKGEDKEETDPDPPTGVPVSGIDRFSIEEMRCFMRFPPSDLRQWNYSIGGSWMSHHRRDDSQTKLLAEEFVSQDVKREAVTEDLGEEEEEETVPSSQSQPRPPETDTTNSTSRATTPSIGRKILRTEPLRWSSLTALLRFIPSTEPLRHYRHFFFFFFFCVRTVRCYLFFFQTLTYSVIFSFCKGQSFCFPDTCS